MSDRRFIGLVQSLLASAEAALGETDSPMTRHLARDGALARRTGERSLELLLMLQQKTNGNLDETERGALLGAVRTVQERLELPSQREEPSPDAWAVRALLQRVAFARVEVSGAAVGEIGPGLLILLGVGRGDSEQDAALLARKVVRLRIFNDAAGKMNVSVGDAGNAALVISQFTLYADTARGNRPSFTGAAAPQHAEALYECFNQSLRDLGLAVATGRFGADMQVSLLNDGPVTVWLEQPV